MLACNLNAHALAGKPGRAVDLLLTHMTISICLAPVATPLLHVPGEALVVPRSGAGLQQCNVFVPSAWGFWGTA